MVPTNTAIKKNWGNSYTIDAWGNLTKKVVSKCDSEWLDTTVNLKNQLAVGTHDAAGNLLSNGGASYTYDGENRIVTTAGVTYFYDGDGVRVKKSGGSSSPTLYWGESFTAGPIAETDLSGTLKAEYVYFGGKRIARRDLPSGAVHYYFSDHLNSTNLVYSSSGTLEEDSDFYPYGGERSWTIGSGNHFKFTGKERDPESGLDYFGARYYGNSLGRFLTPDWADKPTSVPYAEFGDPQSLNLYSYARNAPATKRDADGHEECFANGACNAAKNAYSADHWILNGLTNAASDLFSLDEVAKGSVDMVNAETTRGKVGTATGLILVVGLNLVTGGEGGAAAKTESQLHHIASDKALVSGLTEQFKKIFAGAGMDLKHGANLMDLSTAVHNGRHGAGYNEIVLKALQDATKGLKPGSAEYKNAVTKTLEELRKAIQQDPSILKKKKTK